MSKNISFKVRCALSVATAVAEEVLDNLSRNQNLGHDNNRIRPVLLNMPTRTDFRFEGKIRVAVHLEDASAEAEGAQKWKVRSVFFSYKLGCERISVTEKWFSDLLTKLKELRPWKEPSIFETSEVSRKSFNSDATGYQQGLPAGRSRNLGLIPRMGTTFFMPH